MDRIHATICEEPKIAAIPKMAPITQPQEIRPTAAAMASPMTTSTAIGVAIVNAKLTNEFAPVSKGEDCAQAATGSNAASTVQRARRLPTQVCVA